MSGPTRGSVPFGAVRVVDGDEGRFAAHGQAHIAFKQVGIDLPPQCLDRPPLFIGVGLGDTWRFPDSLDRHFVAELRLARFDQTTDRRRRGRIGTARQRNMPFPGEQPGRRIKANPAGTRQIHLAPGVQVGEVDFGARRAVEAFHVGGQLNQVAGNKPRRQTEIAQQLHQQPCRITAGTGGVLQCVLRSLHAGLHADQVADVFAEALIERHQKIHRRQWRAVDAVQVSLERWRQRQDFEVWRQLLALIGGVAERDSLGVRFEKKIERIEHRHFRDQIDFDAQLCGFFREHQTCQVIALGVLLPVDEMLLGRDFQRIGKNSRAAVGRRAQADDLRAEFDSAVVAIMRDVMQCDMNRHGVPPASLGRMGKRARLMPCTGLRAFAKCSRQYSTKTGRCEEMVWRVCFYLWQAVIDGSV